MTAAAEVGDDMLKSDASRISATAARVAIAAGAARFSVCSACTFSARNSIQPGAW